MWSAVTAEGRPQWPWREERDGLVINRVDGYLIAILCRMLMGTGLDAIYAAAHQIDGPLAAVTIGIAAPLIIKQMAVRANPVGERPDAPVKLPRIMKSAEAAAALDESSGGIDAR